MKKFNEHLQEQLNKMCSSGKLFRVNLTGDQVWDLYLKSFKEDPIFRDPSSSTHNCNNCKNFLRRYGNIVSIDNDYNIVSLFDFTIKDEEYEPVVKALKEAVSKAEIEEVFFETFAELNSLPYESCSIRNTVFKLGIDKNVKQYNKEEAEKYGAVKEGQIMTFNHIHMFLPKLFVDSSGKSVEAIMGEFRDAKNVFQRAMETISLDTLNLVRDLIIQGSLLDGQTHLYKIEQFIPLKKEFDSIDPKKRSIWCWFNSYRLPIAKFRNELIGTLCSELSEGVELNKACQSWNKKVDPVNYMKTTAPITKKQIEEARKFVEENGYTESFDRRFANIDDIKVTEILHSNVGDGKIKSISMFDKVAPSSTRHKRSEFEGIEEVPIEKFMKDILPSCSLIEAFVSNKHDKNMVSLTTSNVKDSKPIFKWKNNYSWTFNGNLAGKSQIKEAVKERGGVIDSVLRFSVIWNESKTDNSDLDAWCEQPNRERIGFNSGFRKDRGNTFTSFSGQLDLDNTGPGVNLGVENIYFVDPKKMKDGVYRFWVNQWSNRGSQGFKCEIEFEGETYSYEFNRPLTNGQNIPIAEVTLKDGQFTIKHNLPEIGVSSKEIYGLESNQFHKINLVCLSPNHWDDNNVGNKHYLFMIDGCKCPTSIRSFHNENLIPELAQHRKVLEVLGNSNMIEPKGKQLSGLGFNATVRDELIVKVQGSFKRMLKIKF